MTDRNSDDDRGPLGTSFVGSFREGPDEVSIVVRGDLDLLALLGHTQQRIGARRGLPHVRGLCTEWLPRSATAPTSDVNPSPADPARRPASETMA